MTPARIHDKDVGVQDRRSKLFPVTVDLEYTVRAHGTPVETGRGRTVALSSNRVLFRCNGPLPLGCDIEVSIAWPPKLKNRVGLKLLVTGRVVGTEAGYVAVELFHYEFRTWATEGPKTT